MERSLSNRWRFETDNGNDDSANESSQKNGIHMQTWSIDDDVSSHQPDDGDG